MIYHEIIIATNSMGVDIVASLLNDLGQEAFEILGDDIPRNGNWDYIDEALINKQQRGIGIRLYVEDNDDYPLLLKAIKASLANLGGDFGSLKVTTSAHDDAEWKDNWKQYFKPFKAGERVVVCPRWEEYTKKPDEIVVTIDPGAAFGSGLHETTKMCIAALEQVVDKDTKVMDVGCGSGILAIAAAKLGANTVLALDYDPISVSVAKENAELNGVDIEMMQSDLLKSAGDATADVVVANIVADIVIRLNADARAVLNKGGIYITSGIIAERLDDVLTSLEKNNYKVLEIKEMGEWRAVIAMQKT